MAPAWGMIIEPLTEGRLIIAFRLIHLGGMIEHLVAGENLAPGFGVDIIVNVQVIYVASVERPSWIPEKKIEDDVRPSSRQKRGAAQKLRPLDFKMADGPGFESGLTESETIPSRFLIPNLLKKFVS